LINLLPVSGEIPITVSYNNKHLPSLLVPSKLG
jgi:hypothetical protein